MDVYFNQVGQYKLLTPEEEADLGGRIAAGDEDAANELATRNLRLVAKIAASFRHPLIDIKDLIAEGNVGLLRAAKRFDPKRGNKFSSYASWHIKHNMRKAIAETCRTIRVPIHAYMLQRNIGLFAAKFEEEFGRTPNDKEICDGLDITQRKLEGAMSIPFAVSLSDPASADGTLTVGDTVPCGEIPPYKAAEKTEKLQELRDAIKKLDKRTGFVLTLRYGLNGGKPETLEEVSKRLKITRERVRQIQARGLKEIREVLSNNNE